MADPTGNLIYVPTDDCAATEAEYKAKGYRLLNIYVGKFYPGMQDLIDRKAWVLQMFKPAPPPQRELPLT